MRRSAVYDAVVDELRAGRKRSHWMWFVFPQLRGLGRSPTAIRFGIASREEAAAYLGARRARSRLRECARLVRGDRRAVGRRRSWVGPTS